MCTRAEGCPLCSQVVIQEGEPGRPRQEHARGREGERSLGLRHLTLTLLSLLSSPPPPSCGAVARRSPAALLAFLWGPAKAKGLPVFLYKPPELVTVKLVIYVVCRQSRLRRTRFDPASFRRYWYWYCIGIGWCEAPPCPMCTRAEGCPLCSQVVIQEGEPRRPRQAHARGEKC